MVDPTEPLVDAAAIDVAVQVSSRLAVVDTNTAVHGVDRRSQLHYYCLPRPPADMPNPTRLIWAHHC